MKLANPVILASGAAGYGVELTSVLDIRRLGGIVLKSVTLDPSRGNPEPRIWETSCGMLNSIGLENVGVDSLLSEVLPVLSDIGIPVIASIAGETVRSYARLARKIDRSGQVAALEVNVSCPNVEKGGLQFGADSQATLAVTMAVCENCDLPVFVKLSSAVADISRVAEAASRAGADGLSVMNTVPGMAIDPVSRRPRLGAVTGGLSGPAIKPVALKAVYDCYRATGMPIIGGGGIYDATDAVEFMIAGAAAVSVGTAIYKDPRRVVSIVDGLRLAIGSSGASSAKEIVGTIDA
jgi:dihydroorotate dehydrogenase (NAD+) catalytic subunit